MILIRLLGSAHVEGEAGREIAVPRKGLALLALVAGSPDGRLPRQTAAALLWEETEETEARHALAATLARLRRVLPSGTIASTGDRLAWQGGPEVVCDLRLFAERVRGARSETGARRRALLMEAATAFGGPLLEGFSLPGAPAFEEWLAGERVMLERRFLELLGELAVELTEVGDFPSLVGCARRALSVDPLQERFHRHLMRGLAGQGDRAAALAQYESCHDLLERELGCAPAAETETLRREIAAEPVVLVASRPKPASQFELPETSPLLGRERELQLLRDRLDGRGRGQLVLLTGEAGIGKTTLLDATLQEVAQRFGTVLFCRCREGDRKLPYSTLAALLASALSALAESDALSPVWLGELARVLPELRRLRPELPVAPAVAPGLERTLVLQAFERALSALPQPVLLAVDDLHHADGVSVALILRPLLASTAGVTMLASLKEADASALSTFLTEARRQGRLMELPLTPLDERALAAFAEQRLGPRGRRVAPQVHRQSGGNPLLAGAYLEMLAAGTPADEAFRELGRMVTARVRRLTVNEEQFLAAASVLEGEATFDVLREVAELGEEEGVRALDRLTAAGLLRQVGRDGDVSVLFRHELVRQAVRAGLAPARRLVLSRRAFHTLAARLEAAQAAPATRPLWAACNEVALLAAEGGLLGEALHWSLRAAATARRAVLMGPATELLKGAYACAERLGDTTAGARARAEVGARLATAVLYTEPRQAERWLRAAENAAQVAGERLQSARVLAVGARLDFYAGRLGGALERSRLALAYGREAADREIEAAALLAGGLALAMRGEFTSALPALARAATLHEEAGERLEATIALVTIGIIQAARGNFVFAEALYERMGAAGGEDPVREAYVECFRAIAAGVQGAWARALKSGRRARRIARRTGYPYLEYLAAVPHGLALARLGDVRRGVVEQRRALILARRAATGIFVPHARGLLALTLLAAGEVAAARANAEEALVEAEAEHVRYDVALARRALGLALAAAGERQKAYVVIREALETAAAIGALSEMARCHALLTHLAPSAAERGLHARAAAPLLRQIGMPWAVAHAALPRRASTLTGS